MEPSITDLAALRRRLRLAPPTEPEGAAATRFALKVSEHVARALEGAGADDPLARQFLPAAEELDEREGFGADPVGDGAARRGAGVLHKYRGRALVVASAACPVHCRYCFRREFPYADASAAGRWDEVAAALRGDPSINEVILSGGDPLSLSNASLAKAFDALAAVPTLARLRLHTRFPTTAPARVDAELLALLASTRFAPVVVVLHVNHPRELDGAAGASVRALRGAGAVLLSQAVLLRGVNDDVATLASLSERLGALGVVPYYLHLLDRVRGAAHFEVPEDEAVLLVRELVARLPGYLVPRLVREVPGEASKTLVPLTR